MNMSDSQNYSSSKQNSQQSSRMLKPEDLTGYFDELNRQTGGRLHTFANTGSGNLTYKPLTADEIRAVGGLGETRIAAVNQAQQQEQDRTGADPSLSQFQKVRALQLGDQQAMSQRDAIGQEREAAITQLTSQESDREYQARLAQAKQALQDYQLLADIYFGGKGSDSQGTSSGRSVSFGRSGSFGIGSMGGGGG